MSTLAAMTALKTLAEAIPGIETCMLGAPTEPAPGDTFILLDWDTDYALNESGGESDDTTTLTLISVIAGGGKSDSDLELAIQIDERISAFRKALEADVTLGDVVSQASIRRSAVQVVPASDRNAWEAGCRIEVEIKEW